MDPTQAEINAAFNEFSGYDNIQLDCDDFAQDYAELQQAYAELQQDNNFLQQDYAILQENYAKLQLKNDFLQQENADLKQENADLKKQIVDLQLSSRPSMNASAPEFKPPTTVKLPAGQATVNQAAVKPPAEKSTVKLPAGQATVNQAAEQSTVKQPAGKATVNQAAEQSTVKQPVPRSARLPAGKATVAQPPPEEKKVQFVDEAAEMAKAIKSATAKYNALSRLPQEGRKVFDISYKKDDKSLSVLEFFCSIGLPKTRNQLEKYSKSLKEEERSEQSCGVTMFMLYHFTTSKTRTSDQDFVDYLCSKKGCIQDEEFFRDVYSAKPRA